MNTTLRPRTIRATAASLAGILVTGLALTAIATPAVAAPITTTDPSGASITLSSGEITAGERIRISGVGFVPVEGSTGEPLVAVRPYDYDPGTAWTSGGADAYDPVAGGNSTAQSEAKHWFITDHTDNGSFEGWIQAPSDLTSAGPLDNGDHWLRILSGAFFTTTGTRLTAAVTFKVPLTVVDKVRLGLTVTPPTGAVFQQGTTFRAGTNVTVKARGFNPTSTVAATLDGSPVAGVDLTTDADGVLPATARLTVPAGTTAGPHTLRLATGANTHDVPITVTPPIQIDVKTPVVRSGGQMAVDLAHFIGVRGTGQKIAVVVNEQVLACIQADATGAGSAVVPVPAGLADGPRSVLFNVGLSCLAPPAGVVNDLPSGSSGRTITISPTAPAVALPGSAVAGQPVTVAGSGFAPSQPVVVTANGVPVPSSLVSDATGTVAGAVTLAGPAGSHRVLVTAGDTVAAAEIAVVAPSASVTSVVLSKPAATYGAARSATVSVTSGGAPATGRVSVSLGGQALQSLALDSAGRASVELPRTTPAGSHVVSASYEGSPGLMPSAGSATLQVKKASATASIKLSSPKVKKSKRAKATVRVLVSGAPSSIAASGRISVYDGSKKIKTYVLSASRRGVLTVTLPKIAKKGTHRLRIVFAGNGNVSAKTSSSVRLTVTS